MFSGFSNNNGGLMPYSNCLACKKEGKLVRLDTPTQGHSKYCRKCRVSRATDKVIRQIKVYSILLKEIL